MATTIIKTSIHPLKSLMGRLKRMDARYYYEQGRPDAYRCFHARMIKV